MRFWTLVISLALYVAVSASLLHAQFQEPRKEELQMTEDPKAPGAAAVYLNVADVADDTKKYRSFYARIKVLQEKGKELATVTIPPHQHEVFKVTAIKGRTIHADGTVIPLRGKPEDLLIWKKSGNQIDQMTFTLPSVEVGSILEYRYELSYETYLASPFWLLQKDYFVHSAHYAFIPLGYLLEKLEQLPPGVEVKTNPAVGMYSLDVSDIPPIPQEDWMPPLIGSQTYQVRFYYKSQSGDYWESEGEKWAKEVDHFAEPTRTIHEAVDGLISSSDSDLEKARKLYKAVQSLDNTDFSRQKSKVELKRLGLREAKRAEDIWTQKSGSREDIALLYLAMLRAAGLTAWDMKVVNRERAVFAPGYLNFDQLDDDIVILQTGGKEVMLDPGEKMCPFQTVSWRHSGAEGVRESASGNAVAKSPFQAFTSNEVKRIGTAFLDEHGGVTGSFRFIMTGQVALYWRQQAILNDEGEVKKLFDRSLLTIMPDGVEGHIDHFIGLDNQDVNLIAVINAKGTLGSTTSKRMLLPGFFFEVRGHKPFIDQSQRQTSVDMHYGEQIIDQVIYQFPSSLSVEGAPQETSISWGDHADLRAKVVQGVGEVTIARSLARAFTFLKPEQYQDLRAFYQKVDANDQQQLVLAINPEHKGN
jgi:transglutaminase-like putative cysteine protease